MLYRAVTVGIVAFWLVMMALLVRLETHPESSDILDLPVSYVMRILFRHNQQSLLTVTQGITSIGSVSLHPTITGPTSRTLNFSGTLALGTGSLQPQRLNFAGGIDMDSALAVRGFHLGINTHMPQYHLSMSGDMQRQSLTYSLSIGTQIVASQTLPMNAGAVASALSQYLGMSAQNFHFDTTGMPAPTVTARETNVTLDGEQLQVYEVTLSEGDTPAIVFDVTELGQIVMAKTSFGLSLAAEDWQ
jgi:hypothetical protein